jgi:hypothetical protein
MFKFYVANVEGLQNKNQILRYLDLKLPYSAFMWSYRSLYFRSLGTVVRMKWKRLKGQVRSLDPWHFHHPLAGAGLAHYLLLCFDSVVFIWTLVILRNLKSSLKPWFLVTDNRHPDLKIFNPPYEVKLQPWTQELLRNKWWKETAAKQGKCSWNLKTMSLPEQWPQNWNPEMWMKLNHMLKVGNTLLLFKQSHKKCFIF